jgi:hypothetical protein
MANLTSNPWSFLQTDVISSPITSLTLNTDGTVTAVVTSTAAFQYTGLVLTSVDGHGNYYGTITGGANNALVGTVATFSGFVNGVNNPVNAEITASSATSISTNLGTIAETHAGAVSGQEVGVTVSDAVPYVYNWYYTILSITNATTMVLVPSFAQPAHIVQGTLAAGAAGQVSACQYNGWIRAEDLKWDLVPPSAVLDMRDRNGNIVWKASQPATAGSPPNYNRGKVFWINGLTLNSVGTAPAILFVTVN